MSKKILIGKVVKDNRSKTITVLVERKYQHPVLKKIIKTKKKYHAHDEKNSFKVAFVTKLASLIPDITFIFI